MTVTLSYFFFRHYWVNIGQQNHSSKNTKFIWCNLTNNKNRITDHKWENIYVHGVIHYQPLCEGKTVDVSFYMEALNSFFWGGIMNFVRYRICVSLISNYCITPIYLNIQHTSLSIIFPTNRTQILLVLLCSYNPDKSFWGKTETN